MKHIIAVLATVTILSMGAVSPTYSDSFSDYISDILNSQYNGIKRKAKGDKKKLAKLAKIRSRALNKIDKVQGMAARPIAVSALKEMEKVVE